MNIEIKKGLLKKALVRLSPNHDERPDPNDITGIVIHNISLPPGEFGGCWIDDLFLNKLDRTAHPCFENIADLHVSAHILIRRDGEFIQYVPFNKRAWHAGLSNWNGRERCNDFTIGIELEGCDDQCFEKIQYTRLAYLVTELFATYPLLNPENIKGHEDISPGRKTDPGPFFDWSHLHELIKK